MAHYACGADWRPGVKTCNERGPYAAVIMANEDRWNSSWKWGTKALYPVFVEKNLV